MNNITPITNKNTEIEKRITEADDSISVSSLEEDDGLTFRQRAFIEYYLGEAKGVAYKAAQMAGYQGDRNTLAAYGCRLLQHPTIAPLIRARVREQLPEARLIESLNSILSRNVSDIGLNAQVKAIELGMKLHGMLVERAEINTTAVKLDIKGWKFPETQTIESTATERDTNNNNQ